ncbi:keratin-associated protein 10-6-like isoform X2 [Arapaima gigas]
MAISCRSYTCNSSSCYSIFMSVSPRPCDPNTTFCELRKVDGVRYSINCSMSCNGTSDRCMNQSQTDCTVECCNSTNCLNSTISSMAMTTTVAPTTKTVTTTVLVTTTTTATPTNGKKCNKLKCSGEKCYSTEPKTLMDCLVGQNFCQLKKIVSGTVMSWEAGCSGNCTGEKPCSSTVADCTQECCNATTTASCLKLDGSVNMPGSSSVGLHPSLLLVASGLLVWAIRSCCLVG